MTTTQSSRIFASGDATTLYVTVPAGVVTDSQFPFAVDAAVTVTIDDGRLVVAPEDDDG